MRHHRLSDWGPVLFATFVVFTLIALAVFRLSDRFRLCRDLGHGAAYCAVQEILR